MSTRILVFTVAALLAMCVSAAADTFEFTLVSANNPVPETKIEMETKCVLSLFGKCRAKTDLPVTYRRTERVRVVAIVEVQSGAAIRDAVEDCVGQAVAAGVVAGLVTGSLNVGTAALDTYLKACLADRARDIIDIRLDRRTTDGPWKKV